jgi:phosphatidylserine decarboxylase
VHQQWLEDTVKHVDENPKDLHPVIQELKMLIENDTRLYLLTNSMFDQIPNKKPYFKNPVGKPQVRDYEHMLLLMNHLMTTAPAYSEKAHRVGLVGLPFHALFDWPMGTPSGFAVFQDPQFNSILKKILNEWSKFLKSPSSAQVLNDSSSGWFGPTGRNDLTTTANNAKQTSLKFEDMFHCNADAENHGFTSWDDFFTRTFREGVRPVASPDRDDIIANSCESLPYKVAYNVHARDKFWLKGQPYSVLDMLAHDELSSAFVGGTIYQAFLSALSYHRWHSPVSGRIIRAYVVDGTYYSEPPYAGPVGAGDINKDGENTGQEYISALATRALIFIEADNPDIGLMCVIAVGMVEVSTCDITVKKEQHVEKGEELGMVSLYAYKLITQTNSLTCYYTKFHFGGSTHCLLFRKGVDVKGFPKPGRKCNVPVRSEVAYVAKNLDS